MALLNLVTLGNARCQSHTGPLRRHWGGRQEALLVIVPFLKDINWLSDIYLKPIPGASIGKSLKAIDKMIVIGSRSAAVQISTCMGAFGHDLSKPTHLYGTLPTPHQLSRPRPGSSSGCGSLVQGFAGQCYYTRQGSQVSGGRDLQCSAACAPEISAAMVHAWTSAHWAQEHVSKKRRCDEKRAQVHVSSWSRTAHTQHHAHTCTHDKLFHFTPYFGRVHLALFCFYPR